MWGKSVSAFLREVRASAHFAPFLKGVDALSPKGEEVRYKLVDLTPHRRAPGFHFLPHAYRCRIEANGIGCFGYGEAMSPLTAIYKSISEAVERTTFKLTLGSPLVTPTSNGWAAHPDLPSFEHHALLERVERDAVLVHWLTQTPLLELVIATLPARYQTWRTSTLTQAPRFQILQILMTTEGYLPTIVAILKNEKGHGVVAHGTSANISSAIDSAIEQACRLAEIVESGFFTPTSLKLSQNLAETGFKYSPEDHSALYAEHAVLPIWLFGNCISYTEATQLWSNRHKFFNASKLSVSYETFKVGSLHVGYARTPILQDLYFGPTQAAKEAGLIRLERFEKVSSFEDLNFSPHAVA